MKKSLIIGVLAILIAGLALVGMDVEGDVAQGLLSRHLEQVNAALASRELPAQVSLEDYRRGWVQSRARYRITFDMPGSPRKQACLTLAARVDHGWAQILTGRWLKLEGTPQDSADCHVLADLQGKSNLAVLAAALKGTHILGSVYFSGDTRIAVSSPAIGQADGKGVYFGAVSAAFRTTRDQQRLHYRLSWDGLKLPTEQALRSAMLSQKALGGVGKLSVSGTQDRYLRHLNTGQFSAHIGSLTYLVAAGGQATRFRLEGLAFEARTKARGGQLDSRMSLDLSSLKLNGVDLGRLHMVGRFDGLDAKPWDRFSDAVVAMRRQTKPGGAETPAAFLARLPRSAVEDGIAGMKDAQFRLDQAEYRLGKHRISLAGQLSWPALETLRPALLKANPAVFLKVIRASLSGNMDAGFPRTLAHRSAAVMGNQSNLTADQVKALQVSLELRADKFVSQLVERGILNPKKGSGGYGLTATYRAGSATLNGRPWPAPKP